MNAAKVIKELAEKTACVQWHNSQRKEEFAVFAKSFSKKIKEWQGKPVHCITLKDMEKTLKKKPEFLKTTIATPISLLRGQNKP